MVVDFLVKLSMSEMSKNIKMSNVSFIDNSFRYNVVYHGTSAIQIVEEPGEKLLCHHIKLNIIKIYRDCYCIDEYDVLKAIVESKLIIMNGLLSNENN